MDTKKHGGSRPKTRPDDKRGGARAGGNRGGAREGSGPLPKKITIAPFNAKKSDTESQCSIVVKRCNYCGAHSVDSYTENVMGWNGNAPTVTIEHDGVEMVHRDHCIKVKGYEPLPKFNKEN